MKPVRFEELLSLGDYERMRALLRPLFIVEKNRRRLGVGCNVTLLFENVQTVWYQVQEMIRTERIERSENIHHELDTYNELIPAPGELSATMLIEYQEFVERDAALRRLRGIGDCLWLIAGDRRMAAKFDSRQMDAERVSSVQFVRFPVAGIGSEELIEIARGERLAIEIDHPFLSASAPIAPRVAAALAEDLRAE